MLLLLTPPHIFPKVLLALALMFLLFSIWLGWGHLTAPLTLTALAESFAKAGERLVADVEALPASFIIIVGGVFWYARQAQRYFSALADTSVEILTKGRFLCYLEGS